MEGKQFFNIFKNPIEYIEMEKMDKTEYFSVKFQSILTSKIPLTSEFDDSAKDEDFRIVKTTIKTDPDQFDEETFDIECLCGTIRDPEPKWKSIIAYPRFAAGSKERNAANKIQWKIEKLIEKA